jgi:hypothetical protein
MTDKDLQVGRIEQLTDQPTPSMSEFRRLTALGAKVSLPAHVIEAAEARGEARGRAEVLAEIRTALVNYANPKPAEAPESAAPAVSREAEGAQAPRLLSDQHDPFKVWLEKQYVHAVNVEEADARRQCESHAISRVRREVFTEVLQAFHDLRALSSAPGEREGR